MSELPQSCVHRLERAREHLDTFEAEARAFLDAQPYKRVIKKQSQPINEAVFTYPDPPLHLSLIVSDYLHELRSCLDSLVFHLAGCPDDHKCRLQFPIFDDPNAYAGKCKVKDGYLEGIPSEAEAVIERLQPYNRPDYWDLPIPYVPGNMPLMRLHDLNRVDKHRTLHLMVRSVAMVGMWGAETDFPTIDVFGPQKDDTNLQRLADEVNVDVMPTFSVSFEDRWPTERMNNAPLYLRWFLDHISNRVLPQFERFFKNGVRIAL
jgi:hypothetical protein